MKRLSSISVYIIIFLSILLSIIEISLNLQESEISGSTQTIWNLVFFILTILWAYNDAREHQYKIPFDFGFLMYFLWPIVFPWYLIKTRSVEGLIILFGFIALWLAPWLSGLVAYSYYS